jgi:hypothetical protein
MMSGGTLGAKAVNQYMAKGLELTPSQKKLMPLGGVLESQTKDSQPSSFLLPTIPSAKKLTNDTGISLQRTQRLNKLSPLPQSHIPDSLGFRIEDT